MQVTILDKLSLIKICFSYNELKWIGNFSLEQIPNGMTLQSFEKFINKCFNNEESYKWENNLVSNSKLLVKLYANLEFFNIKHELEFNIFQSNTIIDELYIENIIKTFENKLDKLITMVNLINYKSNYDPIGSYKDNNKYINKVELNLLKDVNSNKTKLLIGFNSSIKILDLSLYPYECINWSELNNFYQLNELIINGQNNYKPAASNDNNLHFNLLNSYVINIITINNNIKKLTINNIYNLDADIGCLDWVPELEELTLIGYDNNKIVSYIKSLNKLKLINLTNSKEPNSFIFPKSKTIRDNHNELLNYCKTNNITINITNDIEYSLNNNDNNNDNDNINYPSNEELHNLTNMDLGGYHAFP